MAFLQVSFYSQTLETGCAMNVILPEATYGIGVNSKGNHTETPVLYLLHGLSDDHTIWSRRTAIERYSMANGIAVIMPCAARSFYANEAHGAKYFDFIAQELPAVVSSFFNVSSKREHTFIAGLSMGGYGALKIALNYPQHFSAVASFSAVTDVIDYFNTRGSKEHFYNVFGDEKLLIESNSDIFDLLTKTKDISKLPRIMLACGCDDVLYPQHLKLAAELENRNIPFYRRDDQGFSHQWEYWDEMICTAINWMMKEQVK